MIQEILIGDRNVHLVESHTNNGVSTPLDIIRSNETGDYVNKLLKKINYGTNQILPQNSRFIQPVDHNTAMIIIEDRPKIRAVKFLYDFKREFELARLTGQDDINIRRFLENKSSPYVLRLSFPYITYLALIREAAEEYVCVDFRVFFRCHSISKMNDYLYIANILNLSESNSLCFGRVGGYSRGRFSSLSDIVNHLIDSFWAKPFTDEYQSRHYLYHAHSRLHGFLPWAHYTECDPMFIYSTDWIIHDRNIEEEMIDIKRSHIKTEQLTKQIFIDNIMPYVEIQEPERRYIYDHLDLNGEAILNLGDEIIFEESPQYIYSFLGNRNKVTSVSFIDAEGNISDYITITNELKENWANQVKRSLNNYTKSITIDNVTIKEGTIIKIIPTESYEIVQKIRLNRDKRYELLLGKRFYIVNTGIFEILSAFSVDGIKILPSKDYLICNNQYQSSFKGKLTKVENNNYNIIHFFFKDLSTRSSRGVSVDSIQARDISIFDIDDPKISEPKAFWYLNKLYYNDDNSGVRPYTIIKNYGIYSKYNYGTNNEEFPSTYNRSKILPEILSEDRLFIHGINRDIDFKIGDNVIVADWENPENITQIKTITNFIVKYESEKPICLLFELKDSEGNQSSVDYIDFSNGLIRIGYIRKVQTEYDGIPIGSVIRSNISGFYNFPRRVSHKISAFIVDSDRPLILCQSGLTLWLDDVKKNFSIIQPGNSRFRRIRNTIPFNIEKIGWRSGDIVSKNNKLFVLNKDNNYSTTFYMDINANFIKTGSLPETDILPEIDPSFQKYGIPDPRFREEESKVNYRMIPDFHNGYFEVPFDGYYIQTAKKEN